MATWCCTGGSYWFGRHQTASSESPEELIELAGHWSEEEELRGSPASSGPGRRPEACLTVETTPMGSLESLLRLVGVGL